MVEPKRRNAKKNVNPIIEEASWNADSTQTKMELLSLV